jgi:hypothetical protein
MTLKISSLPEHYGGDAPHMQAEFRTSCVFDTC